MKSGHYAPSAAADSTLEIYTPSKKINDILLCFGSLQCHSCCDNAAPAGPPVCRSGRARTTAHRSSILGERGTVNTAAVWTTTSKAVSRWSFPRAGWQHEARQPHETPARTTTDPRRQRPASTKSTKEPDLCMGTRTRLRIAKLKSSKIINLDCIKGFRFPTPAPARFQDLKEVSSSITCHCELGTGIQLQHPNTSSPSMQTHFFQWTAHIHHPRPAAAAADHGGGVTHTLSHAHPSSGHM